MEILKIKFISNILTVYRLTVTQVIEPILEGIAEGAWYGALASVISFLKDENLPVSWNVIFTQEFWSTFQPVKFLKTVLVGMALGAVVKGQFYAPQIAGAIGVSTTNPTYLAVVATAPSMVVYAVDSLVKLIVRRTPLMHVWNKVKAFALKELKRQEIVKLATPSAPSPTKA